MALDGISDTANLGSLVRTLSTMGIDAIILNKYCCNAWYQRRFRVIMGNVFRVSIVRIGLAVLADCGDDGDCNNVSSGSGMIDVLKILDGIGITVHTKVIDDDAQLLETVTDINDNITDINDNITDINDNITDINDNNDNGTTTNN